MALLAANLVRSTSALLARGACVGCDVRDRHGRSIEEVGMRSVLVAMASAVALLCALAVPASANPFTLSPADHGDGSEPVRSGLRRAGGGVRSSVLYENARGRAVGGGQPDEPEQRGRVLAAGPLVGWRRARAAGGRQHRRRPDLDAQRAQVQQLRRRHPATRATTSAIRTRGCRSAPPGRCTRSRSRSTTTRRAMRSWPAARPTAARRGAIPPSCGSTTRRARQQLQRQGEHHRRPDRLALTSTRSGTA